MDAGMTWMLAGTAALLAAVTAVVIVGGRLASGERARLALRETGARLRTYWVMGAVFVAVAVFTGGAATVVIFAFMSFLALREYLTMAPTRRGDHGTLFWVFFVALPAQYVLVGVNWYGFFSIFIPVYAFLFIPIRNALAGDAEKFLERTAKVQWGLMVFVYCVSHAPALMMLDIPGYEGQNAKLLFFLFFIVQAAELVRRLVAVCAAGRPLVPSIDAEETVGGAAIGLIVGALLGWGLHSFTPYGEAEAAGMGALLAFLGLGGRLTMCALFRDRGAAVGGFLREKSVMMRMDSVFFAAPVFFHLTRYFHVP